MLTQEKAVLGRKAFKVALKHKMWLSAGGVGFEEFLQKLAIKIKGQDRICYLFFSVGTLPEEMSDSLVNSKNIPGALALASEDLIIEHEIPEKIFLGFKDGRETHLLILKDNYIENIAGVLGLLSCRDLTFYLFFSAEEDKEKVFNHLRDHYNKKSLKVESFLLISSDVIVYSMANWMNELFLYTSHFDPSEVKQMALESIDPNKEDIIFSEDF